MFASLLDALTGWIAEYPRWAYIIVGLIAFGESLAVFGLIVPGTVLLFGIGALIGSGTLALWPTLLAVTLGAIVGDAVSFWLGHHFRDHLRDVWPFRRYPLLMQNGEAFFQRHGGKSILLARFIGPVRPIVPAVAGMMQMPVARYLTINVLSALLWAPAYLLPGAVFGYALEDAAATTTRLIVLILLSLVVLWALFWLLRSAFDKKPLVTIAAVLALTGLGTVEWWRAQSGDTITSRWQTTKPVAETLISHGWRSAEPWRSSTLIRWLDPAVDEASLPLSYQPCPRREQASMWSHPSANPHHYVVWCIDLNDGEGAISGYRVIHLLGLLRLPIADRSSQRLESALTTLLQESGQRHSWHNGSRGRELSIE